MANYMAYIVYVSVTCLVCIYVGKQCHSYGRKFICHIIQGDEHLADSINNLLLVGYYLVNIGYVIFALDNWEVSESSHHLISQCCLLIARIFIILSVLHYVNLLGILFYGRGMSNQIIINKNQILWKAI